MIRSLGGDVALAGSMGILASLFVLSTQFSLVQIVLLLGLVFCVTLVVIRLSYQVHLLQEEVAMCEQMILSRDNDLLMHLSNRYDETSQHIEAIADSISKRIYR